MSYTKRFSIILLAAAALAAMAIPALAASEAFHDLSFDKAMEKAKKESKLVFIDFYTTWCGPCKMMDRDTFSNEKVIAWLKEHTVALMVDAERDVELANRFHVTAYPTLVFLKPDGKIVGRVDGYMPPEAFLDEAEGALTGKDPLTRAGEKLEKEGVNNPMARLEYAEALLRNDKAAEALEHYLWCLDHGLEHDPEFKRVRLTYLMSSLARLMQFHPPVRQEVRKRLDAVEKELRANPDRDELAAELHAYNQILRQSEKTKDLYTQLKKKRPDARSLPGLLLAMLPEMLERRDYDWIYNEMDLDAQLDAMRVEYREEVDKIKADKNLNEGDRSEKLDLVKRYFAFRMTDFYQLALGAGQTEKAANLSEKILKFNDSSDVLNVLAWSGYLTGKPVKANLEQAKKAYDLTDGRDASVVDTYVRLLYEFDQKDKAATILDKALETVEDGEGKFMLMQCKLSLGLPTKS